MHVTKTNSLEREDSMIGKIVQLIGKTASKDFEIVYGIDEKSFINGRYSLNFGEVTLGNRNPDASRTYIYGGHLVNEKGDGFKDVLVFNGDIPGEEVEEYLLLIIPSGAFQLKTTAKRIAGRYAHEAILEMHPGDTVEVSKNINGPRTVYMAVQAEYEMFLIKRNR